MNDPTSMLQTPESIRAAAFSAVENAVVTDMHTHLYAPEFGPLNLWGIDALLNYHYLIAELFRVATIAYDEFWAMPQTDQADLIWREIFVQRPPISEAAQGVVRVMTTLGLDPAASDLRDARAFFAEQDPAAYAEKVLNMARVGFLVMTNDPFDDAEAGWWRRGAPCHERYRAALRLDHLLVRWPQACVRLRSEGYDVAADVSGPTCEEVRRFLSRWIDRMKPLYMAVSLGSDFAFPDESPRTRLLRSAVLPSCREHGLPMGLMIGVRRQVNPALGLAGDGVGKADVTALERIAAEFPEVRFLVTLLSRENQHELCVSARKFRNVLPFGCWWFLNNPSIVQEITRERLEMLGATFVAQHSDARVLDQLLYKWPVSRKIIGEALGDAYVSLSEAGRRVTRADMEADVARLLGGNFRRWVGMD